ncbi:hypothetical protein HZC35_03305 [Candidatus Saganbacteria bacterium]|nr:hypothetical protein [Candidatus Saganbacteria bacterium]
MRKLKVGLGLLIAAAMLVGIAGMGWGVPNIVNVQGRLVDKATGNPIASQTLDVTVNYYQTLTGGSPISGISGAGYSPATDANGVFNLALGEGLPDSNKPDFSADLYVEFVVTARVGGVLRTETLAPRQRMVSVPGALSVKGVATNFNTTPVDARISNVGNSQNAVYAETNGSGFASYGKGTGSTSGGVKGEVTNTTNSNYAVSGYSAGTGAAVYGNSVGGYGISGRGPTTKGGVTGTTNASLTSAFTNFGVLGDSSGGYGVVGNSYSSYGIYGISVSNSGIYGSSTSGSGIFGDSANGSGVRGRGAGGSGTAGVWGENVAVSNGWGIYGTSANGYGVGGNGVNAGVWGTSTGTATSALPMLGAGVFGNNTQTTIPTGGIASPGVYGASASGPGIQGNGNKGVVGTGTTIGVDATGGTMGVKGESNGVAGVAAYARAASASALLVQNTVDGTAIDLVQGKIKIAASTGMGTSSVPKNTPAGTFTISGTTSLGEIIYNTYVTANSIILLSVQNSSAAIPLYVRTKSAGNSFTVAWSGSAPIGTSVGYLIIN